MKHPVKALRSTVRLLVAAGLVLSFGPVQAATFYVSVTGDDANPGTEALPWQTIQQAANTLVAGDTVIVGPGTYSEPFDGSPNPSIRAIKPQNSGAMGSPIVFTASSDGPVVIDQGGDLDTAGFYIEARDFIEIRGFEITNAASGVTVFAGDITQLTTIPTGIVISNNFIHDIQGAQGGNIGAVRLNGCADCEFTDNVFSDIAMRLPDGSLQCRTCATDNQNLAGILAFDALRATVRNNDIQRVHTGVFFKRASVFGASGNPGSIVERNRFSDVFFGTRYSIAGAGDPAHFSAIVDRNLFLGTTTPAADAVVVISLVDVGAQSEDLQVTNNVFEARTIIDGSNFLGILAYNNAYLPVPSTGLTANLQEIGFPVGVDAFDFNAYSPTPRFNLRGAGLDLAAWRLQGFDQNSLVLAETMAMDIGVTLFGTDHPGRLQTGSILEDAGSDDGGTASMAMDPTDIGAYPAGPVGSEAIAAGDVIGTTRRPSRPSGVSVL